jgi:VanZ family protein
MISTTINGIRIASLCLVGYWLVLFIGTHLPRVRIPSVAGANDDKILHVIAFAGLSFLLSWAIPTKLTDRFRNVRLAALAAILYGAFDELTQIPVGRTADWKDLIADIIGACVGIIAYCIMREILWKIKPLDHPKPTSPSDLNGSETKVSLQGQATR